MQHLQPIQPLLDRFMDLWKDQQETEGIFLTGSWVDGSATEDSDIDLRVVLSNETQWTEARFYSWEGKRINNWAASPIEMAKRFHGQWLAYSRFDARTFQMSHILWDKNGTVKALMKEAAAWMNRPFKKLPDEEITLLLYKVAGGLDELQKKDVNLPMFKYDYFQYLEMIRKTYWRKFNLEETDPMKFSDTLINTDIRKKYGLAPLPHPEFVTYFSKALQAIEQWDNWVSVMELKEMVTSLFPTIPTSERAIRFGNK